MKKLLTNLLIIMLFFGIMTAVINSNDLILCNNDDEDIELHSVRPQLCNNDDEDIELHSVKIDI